MGGVKMSDRSTEAETALPTHNPQPADFDFEQEKGVIRRLQQFLHEHPTMVPLTVLVLVVAMFSFLAGARFYHPFNLSLILAQVTIIGTIGIAQTLIILTA